MGVGEGLKYMTPLLKSIYTNGLHIKLTTCVLGTSFSSPVLVAHMFVMNTVFLQISKISIG